MSVTRHTLTTAGVITDWLIALTLDTLNFEEQRTVS
jgi:hypothetical protein